MKNYHPCFIIPCYNHGSQLALIIEKFVAFNIPIIIVNDGSTDSTAETLEEIKTLFPSIQIITLTKNQGKGKALMMGFKAAVALQFTHAIQIDADGQHDLKDIPLFLKVSSEQLSALISGHPVYDESIPKSRLYSRYITHFWVWIETLSFTIKDSMCGFRIYPLPPVTKLLEQTSIGHYMDFDTEIMVKLYWAETPIIFIPTKVIYPDTGVSHFRAVKDNILISWMHTRLFFGMLWRLPRLIKRKLHAKK